MNHKHRWDSRKKKFVKDFESSGGLVKDDNEKKRKNEAGRKIEKGYAKGTYERWKNRSKSRYGGNPKSRTINPKP